MPISPAGGAPYTGPKEVSYLFVDGGYLRKVAERFGKDFFGGAEPPINYVALGARFTRCFYYDCLPAQRAGEASAEYEARVSQQRAQLSTIRSLHGWHVIEGVVTGTGSRARQKQVDIHIAVDLLTHTYNKNMHQVAFVAGDQDFKPLVEAVVRHGMFIEIWYENSSASVDLLDAADGRRLLDLYTFFGYLEASFRQAHPLPTRGRPMTEQAILERTGESSGARVELYRDASGYTIVRSDDRGRLPEYLAHEDCDLLERVFEAIYGEVSWASTPVAPPP